MTPTHISYPVTDGIRKFIRALGRDDLQAFQLRQQADEHDLIDALSSVKSFYSSYLTMHEVHDSKVKDGAMSRVLEDTLKDMEEYLLKGTDERQNTIKWARNASMYVLVVEPTIQMLAPLTAYTSSQACAIVDSVIDEVVNTDAHGDHDDALVAREQIRHILATYREQHPSASRTKQQSKPKRKRGRQDYDMSEDDQNDRFSSADSSTEALDFN